jgi:hypothetical protein
MSQVYPDRDLILSKHANISEYRIGKDKQQFLLPNAHNKQLKANQIDNSQNSSNNSESNGANTSNLSNNNNHSNPSNAFPSTTHSRNEPYNFSSKPHYKPIQSSGPREIVPGQQYKSRLGLRDSNNEKYKQSKPIKLFTHESAIKREFYSSGTHGKLW